MLHFSDGTFKIMQIADIQEDYPVNPDTIKLISLALDKEKPDLAVLTGDQIQAYSRCYKTDAEKKVKEVINAFITPLEERNIPFCITFGNHDDDGSVSKDTADATAIFQLDIKNDKIHGLTNSMAELFHQQHNNKNENETAETAEIESCTKSNTDGGGGPKSGSGCKTANGMVFGNHNCAGTKKTEAGHNSSRKTGNVGNIVILGKKDVSHHNKRRANADNHVCTKACCLPALLASETQNAAANSGEKKPYKNRENVRLKNIN